MKIEFPTEYKVTYPIKNVKNFEKISKRLRKASSGYCMYCGRKLVIDNEEYFHIEHSIEQDGYAEGDKKNMPFTYCKFNVSYACMKCNLKYKKRMIERLSFEMVGKEIPCKDLDCREPCDYYKAARNQYIKKNRIILQPAGARGENGKNLEIQYDLIKQIFIPALSEGMQLKERELIQEHIARFNLNENTGTSCLIVLCELIYKMIEISRENCEVKDIVNILNEISFDNIVAESFKDFIVFTMKEILDLKDFCELFIVLSYI